MHARWQVRFPPLIPPPYGPSGEITEQSVPRRFRALQTLVPSDEVAYGPILTV
jgi:hypothetical protein